MKLNTSDQQWRVSQSVKDCSRMNFVTVTLIEQEDDPKVIFHRLRHW